MTTAPGRWPAFIVFAVSLSMTGFARSAVPQTMQVLFVGNGLTHVGKLPAVFTALAAGNGHPVHADMLVKGGATLTQRLDPGAVPCALQAHHYDYVVLQERGNDFACGFGPQVGKDSRHALHALAQITREHGAQPILAGTCQYSRDEMTTTIALAH